MTAVDEYHQEAMADLKRMGHRDRALRENFEWLTVVAGLSAELAAARLGFTWVALERRIYRNWKDDD